MSKRKKRVLVGMSGGVDSSVTAALLKKRGYDVIGMTMQLLPKEEEKESACCNLGAISDAKRVANRLKIPHYTINSRDVFHGHVIDDFIEKYANGFTPNPCVECNRHIKFDELIKKLKELDADFVATGHYCRVTRNTKTGEAFLKKAKDDRKDQSYFLYMLNQEKLRRILFPLGAYTKPEVRQIAEELGLINAQKPDSQEICFVSQKSYKDFVRARIPLDKQIPGPIVDKAGKKIGEHAGIFNFTVGQRRGLSLPSPEPLYVLEIDPKTHTVVVGSRGDVASKTIHLQQFSLINPAAPISGKTFEIKTRYQMSPQAAKILTFDSQGHAEIALLEPQEFITPGQSAVLYDGERVVGGGIIAARE